MSTRTGHKHKAMPRRTATASRRQAARSQASPAAGRAAVGRALAPRPGDDGGRTRPPGSAAAKRWR